MFFKSMKLIPILFFLLLLYLIFFLHLGRQPLRLADEGRLAHNAYNMSNNGDFIVTYFEGNPDMWNTKPPLMIWCQVVFIKLFGPNETAMRLPAAIGGLLTSLLLFYFCWKHFQKFWMGFSAALILATSNSFVLSHGSRNGEYDSLLVLFITIYTLYYYLYFEKGKTGYLYLATFALICAVLTKGIAGLLILPPIIFAYFFYSEKKRILSSPHFYSCLFGFIFFVGGYYLFREIKNPGYLQAVNNNELWGRYVVPTEIHDGSFWMYWDYLKNRDMPYWFVIVTCGIIAGLMSPEKMILRFTRFIIFCISFFFLVISVSASKLHWYSYPMYPFLALAGGYFIWMIFDVISQLDVRRYLKRNVLPYFFILIIFYYPYDSMLAKIYLAPELLPDLRDYSIGYYLQRVINGKEKLNEPLKIYYMGQNAHVTFYVEILKEKKVPVSFAGDDQLQKNHLVICSLPADKLHLKEHFKIDSVKAYKDAAIYRIL